MTGIEEYSQRLSSKRVQVKSGTFHRKETPRFMIIHILTVCVFSLHVGCLELDSVFCRCEKYSLFHKPFVVLWNSPTEGCHVNFSVNIELEKFGILTNTNQTWDGEVVTVFYNAQIGLYPYFEEGNLNQSYNGGLPQLVNMTKHLLKSSEDIAAKIPDPDFQGVAVIDWEAWRPLWETNFWKKRIYQTRSIELVKSENIFKKDEIEKEAKRRFEKAARHMMEETIKLARKLRPKALWGFYGFPTCYGSMETGYRCEEENKRWNDKIHWLYESSTTLFPSIYLMEEHIENNKFVAEKLTEAFRVSLLVKKKTNQTLPVFPYLRPLYVTTAHQFKMLNEDDLENAIGQAADLGCAGLVLWGNHNDDCTSKGVCTSYNDYINKKLGPYISSLTEELETCSKVKCSSNGRCIDKSTLALKLFNNEANVKRDCHSSNTSHTVFNNGGKSSKPGDAGKQNTSHHEIRPLTKSKEKIEEKKMKDAGFINRDKSKKDGLQQSHLNSLYPRMDLNKTTDQTNNKHVKSNSSKKSSRKIPHGDHKTKLYSSTIKQRQRPSHGNITQIKSNSKSESGNPEGLEKDLGLHNHENKINVNGNLKQEGIESHNELSHVAGHKRPSKTSNITSHKHKESDNQVTIREKATRKPGYSAAASDETAVHIPSVYIILITVTLGGALLMTVIYVAIYYAVNVQGRSYEHNYDAMNYGSNDENPFSMEDGSWWYDNVDQKEKLLSKEKEKR